MVRLANNVLFFDGDLRVQSIHSLNEQVLIILAGQKPVTINLSGVESIDSAGVAFLEDLQEKIKQYSPAVFLQEIPANVQQVINTFSSSRIPPEVKPAESGFLENLGGKFAVAMHGFFMSLVMAADVFYWASVGLLNRGGQKKGSFIQQAYMLGVQALPVVGLMALMIGFILSLQSGTQLRNFGAGIYIADLLSISFVREMGPLITAIIVAGRSGSAIASEIATMQVSEEIDALRMMAVNPIRYVVIPKFHALSVVMPILVAYAIIIGLFGSLLIAVGYLDISVNTFISRAIDILTLKDIIVSFTKSMFFAWVIIIISSYFGFSVKGGAEGVGKATTNSVVASIFTIVFFDSVFSLIYL